MTVPTILIADDEVTLAQILARILKQEGYETVIVSDGQQAVKEAQKTPFDLAILDLKMPNLDGFSAFRQIKRLQPSLPVILMTAYGNVEIAVNAMKEGAFDYIPKPFNADELLLTIKRAFHMKKMALEVSRLSKEVEELRNEARFALNSDFMVGRSPVMQEIFKQVGKVAQSAATVLIRGETGVGKEVIAKAIHFNSPRNKGPMIKINCGAIPENLLESELFGYEKGAFTGAANQKPGKFELANGGTLFLDEIGELSPLLQVKLLRAIQEKEIERVGGTRPVKIDVRIIAATHVDLEKAVAEGRFREDLYYRLNVITIDVPPLRNRGEDILLLAEYFLLKYGEEMGRENLFFSEECREALLHYNWPGNVRQLQNAIERAVVMAEGNLIQPEDFSFYGGEKKGPENRENPAPAAAPPARATAQGIRLPEEILLGQSLKDLVSEVEKQAIQTALKQTGGNKARAAKLLDISRRSLQYKAEEYGIGD